MVATAMEFSEGPANRMIEAGASGYLPPPPVDGIGVAVHAHLTRQDALTREASAASKKTPGAQLRSMA